MVFCNKSQAIVTDKGVICHNPYFNRWFSAIKNLQNGRKTELNRHNPYFNRWFSAINVFFEIF